MAGDMANIFADDRISNIRKEMEQRINYEERLRGGEEEKKFKTIIPLIMGPLQAKYKDDSQYVAWRIQPYDKHIEPFLARFHEKEDHLDMAMTYNIKGNYVDMPNGFMYYGRKICSLELTLQLMQNVLPEIYQLGLGLITEDNNPFSLNHYGIGIRGGYHTHEKEILKSIGKFVLKLDDMIDGYEKKERQ